MMSVDGGILEGEPDLGFPFLFLSAVCKARGKGLSVNDKKCKFGRKMLLFPQLVLCGAFWFFPPWSQSSVRAQRLING